jgi:hypothetical protein
MPWGGTGRDGQVELGHTADRASGGSGG